MPKISLAEKASRVIVVQPDSRVKQRLAALQHMNPALRSKLNDVEQMLTTISQNSIMFNYKLGALLKDIRMNPKKYGGDTAMDLIERALPGRADLIRRSVQFAMEMTAADADELSSLENTDAAFRLNWGHLIVLLTLKNKEQRLVYAKRAISELLEPAALHKLIQSKTGKKNNGGRPHKLPATIPGQLRQVKTKTTDWIAKHEAIWDGNADSAFDNMLSCSADVVTVDMLNDARATREALAQMAELAKKDIDTFDKIIERIERCLRNEV